ncbi:hypothetical protein [Amycolatopsis magusensis]|uniref:hypothetical protein n=1 Tax=Amycolatopsis magusensis TaxID=882444 RepID=UPI0037A5338E
MSETPAAFDSEYARAHQRLAELERLAHTHQHPHVELKLYRVQPSDPRHGRTFRASRTGQETASPDALSSGTDHAIGAAEEWSSGIANGGGGWLQAMTYVVPWISLAAASGVIGNATYDAVKRVTARVFAKREDEVKLSAYGPEDAQLVAKLVVMTRCAQLDWPMPRFDDFTITHLQLTGESEIWQVALTAPGLTAEVAVKRSDPSLMEGQSMPTTILRKPSLNS